MSGTKLDAQAHFASPIRQDRRIGRRSAFRESARRGEPETEKHPVNVFPGERLAKEGEAGVKKNTKATPGMARKRFFVEGDGSESISPEHSIIPVYIKIRARSSAG